MSYDIPDEIKYREKIVFWLDLRQLCYLCAFEPFAFLSPPSLHFLIFHCIRKFDNLRMRTNFSGNLSLFALLLKRRD